MARTLAALVLSATIAAAGPAPAAAGEPPLLRMRDGVGSDLVFRVHPVTLRPLGRPIRTFQGGYDLAFSPDGRMFAFADGAGLRSRIHIVDVANWRSRGVVPVRPRSYFNVGWVGPRRLVAITDGLRGRKQLVWIDPLRRRVVARHPFRGNFLEGLSVPGGYAIALAPEEGLGTLRVLVAGADGSARAFELDGIRAGMPAVGRRGRYLKPGLAVDAAGGRLFGVAARGEAVAELDLATGAVARHALGASAAKGNVDVWLRYAQWAGEGKLLVHGERFPPPRRRGRPAAPQPFGARLIDTSDWSVATLDARPRTAFAAGGTVLATGRRTGLLAFDLSGERRFTLFPGRSVVSVGSRGRLGYAWLRRTRTLHVIDLRDGRTLRRVRTGKRIPFLLFPR